jgi:predicted dithiol-disulfide oxidoreductase (DUF899 family)
MSITFPGESAEYRAARDRLLADEIELRRATERVAARRRALPPGGVVPEDYAFAGVGADGRPTEVRLSQLFAPGMDDLIVYSMMFPRDRHDDRPGLARGRLASLPLLEMPCPSCVALVDELDRAARHATQNVSMAVSAKTSLARLRDLAAERGWEHVQLVSAAGTTFTRDYHGESADGDLQPMLNVFHRDGDTIRHFWASEMLFAPTDDGQDPRHVGTIEALWNLLDLTPGGRRDEWHEQLAYPA